MSNQKKDVPVSIESIEKKPLDNKKTDAPIKVSGAINQKKKESAIEVSPKVEKNMAGQKPKEALRKNNEKSVVAPKQEVSVSVERQQPSPQRTQVSQQPQQQQQSNYQNNRSYSKPRYNQNDQRKNSRQQYRAPRQNSGYRDNDTPELPKDLNEMSLYELNQKARMFGIVGASLMRKPQLIEKIKYAQEHPDKEMVVQGVLEKLPDGFGFLRSKEFDYVSSPDDVYVSPSQIRRFGLRIGDTIKGVIRKPKENEKYFALLKVDQVNDQDPLKIGDRIPFDCLSPIYPSEKLNLVFDPSVVSTRIMDLFTPIGKGQRGLMVAPPKVGKTMLLKDLARALVANHSGAHIILLLIDERPEEVADMRRTLQDSNAEVISSTFDESAERHVQVADIVLEKAKRLVEIGRDVVILLDSITRLARAYNTTAPASGKVLTGGIDANALQRPKRFFGAARNIQEGGSLTIIATAMVDTGSRMDEVIYEEFKGTGNMEMHLSRKLSNRRIFPAFDLLSSSTRREELLLSEKELTDVWVLRKLLGTMNGAEGMEFLTNKIKKTKTNEEFLDGIHKRNSDN